MRYLILPLVLLLVSCSSTLPSIKTYKMDVQQGNVITPKMMLQLKPAMTKSQVRFILGTPLLADTFHRDRWDYFYEMNRGGKVIERRRVILEFEKSSRFIFVSVEKDTNTTNETIDKTNKEEKTTNKIFV